MKTMLCITAAAAVLTATAAQAAEPLGVAVCDEFITKYEACVGSKIPAAQQASFKTMLDQMRASWAGLAKSPEMKPQLEASCKASIEQMKTALQPHGCSF